MRILLVEDEAPLRETLAARLKREGFAVDAAADGEEGLYLAREMPFDVAIVDLGLPKRDGIEVLRKIRSNEDPTHIPVVILSSSREERDLAASWDLGVNAYVVKPVDAEQFFEAVQALGQFWAVMNQARPDN